MTFATFHETTETNTGTGWDSDSTNHAVTMPTTVNANDLLLCFLTFDSGDPVSATPTGWTAIRSDRQNVYAKKAVGDEDSTTVNFTTGTTEQGAAHVRRYSGWSEDITQILGTFTESGNTNAPDPPSHTAAEGAQDNVWVAAVGSFDDQANVSSPMANYGNLTSTVGGSGANVSGSVASCDRQLNASVEDPAAFSLSTSDATGQGTIVIPPFVVLADPAETILLMADKRGPDPIRQM